MFGLNSQAGYSTVDAWSECVCSARPPNCMVILWRPSPRCGTADVARAATECTLMHMPCWWEFQHHSPTKPTSTFERCLLRVVPRSSLSGICTSKVAIESMFYGPRSACACCSLRMLDTLLPRALSQLRDERCEGSAACDLLAR